MRLKRIPGILKIDLNSFKTLGNLKKYDWLGRGPNGWFTPVVRPFVRRPRRSASTYPANISLKNPRLASASFSKVPFPSIDKPPWYPISLISEKNRVYTGSSDAL